MQFVSEYTIPVNGRLTRWEIFTGRADSVILQVWRPSGALDFALVGSSPHSAPAGYSSATVSISVQAGDVLGWFCAGIQPIKFDSGGQIVRRAYGYDGTATSVSMSGHATGWARTYSIRAAIETSATTVTTTTIATTTTQASTASTTLVGYDAISRAQSDSAARMQIV